MLLKLSFLAMNIDIVRRLTCYELILVTNWHGISTHQKFVFFDFCMKSFKCQIFIGRWPKTNTRFMFRRWCFYFRAHFHVLLKLAKTIRWQNLDPLPHGRRETPTIVSPRIVTTTNSIFWENIKTHFYLKEGPNFVI